MDYDALMHAEDDITLDSGSTKVSRIFHDLWELGMLNNDDLKKIKSMNSQIPQFEFKKSQFIYPDQAFDIFIRIAHSNNIFVFQKDIEGSINAKQIKRNKPLKAVEKVLKLIQQDSIPSEFYEMTNYLRKKINEAGQS